ncbi:unnamed protein product [Schistosoma mattheei]|nr:unnamed protein product [Schistosoma mattheei]
MRPPTDYQDNSQKPRNKSRKHKGMNESLISLLFFPVFDL